VAVTLPNPVDTPQPRSQALTTALRHLKFAIPAVPRGVLDRTELVAAVRAEIFDGDNALTLVCAPAGSGKTVLLAGIAAGETPGQVAWCTLDVRDNDPVRFSRSVLEAVLASGSPEIVSRAAAGGRGAQDPLEEALLVAGCGGEMLLVLDEGEHLQAERAHAALRRVVALAPANVKIVVLTNRSLIMDRQARVATLRGPQLEFTLDEMRALFTQRHVSTADVELLHGWTHGLPAAVALAATAYGDPRTRDRIVRAALRRETTPYIAIYDTLLDRLDDEVRAVLVASSVADPVSGDLGEALTGDPRARTMITELARTGMYFDAIPGCTDWYRHRYPSRNLLRARLVHERPEDVARLHSCAGRWFRSHGDLDRAIDNAVLGIDAALAHDLIRERWTASAIDEVDSGLARVPSVPADADEPDRFEAALTEAAVALEHDDDTAALAFLERRSSDLAVAPSAEWELFALLIALRVARSSCDAAAIRSECERLRTWAAAHGMDTDAGTGLDCFARRALADAALIEGDLDGASELLERVYRDATVTGREQQMVAATAAWAVVTALTGRVRQAGALIDEVGDASASGSAWSKGVCALARGIHEYHADSPLAANAAASEARSLLHAGVHRDVVLPMLRARLKASIGDEACAARLRARAQARATPALLAIVSEALGLSMISAVDARAALDVAAGAQHPYACARRSLRLAFTSYEEQRPDEAWVALDHALALVDRHRFHRIALDSGLDVGPMLRDYIAQAGTFTPLAWRLLQRMPTLRDGEPAPNVETLTDRELAVLRHLPSMKSNQEIAAEMYFSVNTIKTHLKSIYRKLGVNRRRDAVEEARARSLL
jgi:LuxR family maltose regulon positive regulatory protein